MIEVIQGIINLMVQFINFFFTIYVDWGDIQISVGLLASLFIFIMLVIYLGLWAFRIYGGDK